MMTSRFVDRLLIRPGEDRTSSDLFVLYFIESRLKRSLILKSGLETLEPWLNLSEHSLSRYLSETDAMTLNFE